MGAALRAVGVAVVATVVLALAGLLILSWRLSEGPLDVGWAARRIEAAANLPDQPTRLAIGHAAIRWGILPESRTPGPNTSQPDPDSVGRGLELTLTDVRLVAQDGRAVATLEHVELTVSMARLLLGEVVPRALSVAGLNASLLRGPDGVVAIDLGGLALPDDDPAPAGKADAAGPTLRNTLTELARPVRRPGTRPKRPDLQNIEELARVRMERTQLRLTDPALGQAVLLEIGALDLTRRPGGGVRGSATAALRLGAARANLVVQADLAPNGGTQVQLAFSPVNATTVQAQDPALATADVLDAAVKGAASLTLDQRLHPTAAALRLEAAGGKLRLAGGVIGFDSLLLDGTASWDEAGAKGAGLNAGSFEAGLADQAAGPRAAAWGPPQHLVVTRANAVVHAPGGSWPSTLNGAGRLDRTAAGYAGELSATLDHLAFADIGALWPVPLGGHIRPWLVPNVTGGIARDGSIKASFTAPPGFADLTLKSIDASAKGEDVVIWWLRPVPPVEAAQAVLTFKDPAFMDIAVSSARQGTVALTNGQIRITGLDQKDQFLAMSADVAGGVPEVLTLLRNPTLQLLSKSPIPIRSPAGALTGHLAVNLPLNDVVPFEDIRIATTARATGLHLSGLVAGRDLDRGTITTEASTEAFHAAGTALLGGVPSDLTVDMDFKNGGPAQVVQKATVAARATARQLAAAGLDTGGLMQDGTGQFNARFSQRRDGAGEVQVTGDLRDAGLALAGWSKKPGDAASVSARLVLRGDALAGIDQIRARGPGMAVDGRADMVGDQPLLLVLDQVSLGQTRARGQVRLPAVPGTPIQATLTGTVLDLSDALKQGSDAGKPDDKSAPFVADVRFDRVLLSPEGAPAGAPVSTPSRGLSGVVAHAENDGRRLSALSVTSAAPEQVQATIKPEGTGRRLTLRAADAGGLLRAARLAESVQGGKLVVDALYDDRAPGSPLAGTAEIKDFTVRDAPALGKLLQAVTIYGVVDAMRGPGLVFSDLMLPFRWDGSVLGITDARAFSASLGLTARGQIDTGRGTLDVQGTVVPAYVLNSALGRIPLIGKLFSRESGGGLLAVDYALRGKLADPTVRVNPLSALTPGFLRGLFHIFD